MENQIIAHRGARFVDFDVVEAIPVPEATDTYRPVSHLQFLDNVADACSRGGIVIGDQKYCINPSGERLFALWNVEQIGDDTYNGDGKMAIGLRNSYDRSVAMGICAGRQVFVCDNLALSGEFVEFRKHTMGLTDDDIRLMAENAVVKLIKKVVEFSMWFQALRAFKLKDERHLKALMLDAVAEEVIPAPKIKAYLEAAKMELRVDSQPSLNTLYQTHTRVMRGKNLFAISKGCKEMNDFMGRQLTFNKVEVQ